MSPDLAANMLRHMLRVVGLGPLMADRRIALAGADTVASRVIHDAEGGAVVLLQRPVTGVCAALGVTSVAAVAGPWRAHYLPLPDAPFAAMRGLFDARAFAGDAWQPVLATADGAALWLWRAFGRGGVLLIGSDLPADLVRFRQGDPGRVDMAVQRERWGYAGERPNYLFEGDLDANALADRPADWPLFALAHFIGMQTGAAPAACLPGGAICALVITGDTDGATEEHYAHQRRALGDLPITYFLRPACAAPRTVLRALDADSRVDLQLHPDALDEPERYPAFLREQVAWFTDETGRAPTSVRNHGYLNDRYWGHARPWLETGQRWSANLPGVDGCVLNGSLLPGRLLLDGALTPHWSLLTPFGDGMMFSLGLSAADAAARIAAYMERIVDTGAPAVVTLNLHPANIALAEPLHAVLHTLVARGALAWSLANCAAWFERIDQP